MDCMPQSLFSSPWDPGRGDRLRPDCLRQDPFCSAGSQNRRRAHSCQGNGQMLPASFPDAEEMWPNLPHSRENPLRGYKVEHVRLERKPVFAGTFEGSRCVGV